jgi:hypothetical protein
MSTHHHSVWALSYDEEHYPGPRTDCTHSSQPPKDGCGCCMPWKLKKISWSRGTTSRLIQLSTLANTPTFSTPSTSLPKSPHLSHALFSTRIHTLRHRLHRCSQQILERLARVLAAITGHTLATLAGEPCVVDRMNPLGLPPGCKYSPFHGGYFNNLRQALC